jgi:hypothetical protein
MGCAVGAVRATVQADWTSLFGGEPQALTREQLITNWRQLHPGFTRTTHVVGVPTIAVNGNTAHASASVAAWHFLEEPRWKDENLWLAGGTYEIEFVKRDGAWQITAMVYLRLSACDRQGRDRHRKTPRERGSPIPSSHMERYCLPARADAGWLNYLRLAHSPATASLTSHAASASWLVSRASGSNPRRGVRGTRLSVASFNLELATLRLNANCVGNLGSGSPHWTISATGSSENLRKSAFFRQIRQDSRSIVGN